MCRGFRHEVRVRQVMIVLQEKPNGEWEWSANVVSMAPNGEQTVMSVGRNRVGATLPFDKALERASAQARVEIDPPAEA